jgi:hypothetical protein
MNLMELTAPPASLEALLAAPPAEAQREAWARQLVERLDDGSLDGLADPSGVPYRSRAVEALIALGWPWALYVSPEDLDALRELRAPRFSTLQLSLAGLVIVVLLAWWLWV